MTYYFRANDDWNLPVLDNDGSGTGATHYVAHEGQWKPVKMVYVGSAKSFRPVPLYRERHGVR